MEQCENGVASILNYASVYVYVCVYVCAGEQPGGEINISQRWRKIAREVGEILNKYYDEYKLSYDSLARPTHIHGVVS